MRRNSKFIAIVAGISFVALAGYGIMYLLTYAIPMTENTTLNHLLFTVILIALGLTIPYWMLKLLFDAARMRNPHEKNLHLSDIPKDKDQLTQK
jgi:hypothetical protein